MESVKVPPLSVVVHNPPKAPSEDAEILISDTSLQTVMSGPTLTVGPVLKRITMVSLSPAQNKLLVDINIKVSDPLAFATRVGV